MVLVISIGVVSHNPHALWAEWNPLTRSSAQELNLYSLPNILQSMTRMEITTSGQGNAWMAVEESVPVNMFAREGEANPLPFISQAAASLYGTLKSE